MKSLMLVAAAMLFVSSAFAQGTIRFANEETSYVVVHDFSITWLVPSDAAFVQLLWAPHGTSLTPYDWFSRSVSPAEWLRQNPAWSFAGIPVPIGPQAGLYDGGTVTIPTTPGATIEVAVAGWGIAVDLQTAWDRGLEVGVSYPVSVKTGLTPESAATPIYGQLTLYVGTIPEPSALALLALGAALFLLRPSQTS